MKEISGLMIYYYFICKRKLWYYINNICMEQNSELVKIGSIIDDTSYIRERKQILIDNAINIDFIKNKVVLNEVKKSKSIEEAGIWQIKYYMYYLEKRGVKNIKAKIDYPMLRKTENVTLIDDDRQVLDEVVENIKLIINENKPQDPINEKICKKCSYFDICYV